jgi:hypothetical protein
MYFPGDDIYLSRHNNGLTLEIQTNGVCMPAFILIFLSNEHLNFNLYKTKTVLNEILLNKWPITSYILSNRSLDQSTWLCMFVVGIRCIEDFDNTSFFCQFCVFVLHFCAAFYIFVYWVWDPWVWTIHIR